MKIYNDQSNGHKLKYKMFLLNIRKHFFYSEGALSLAQVAQGDCGCISILELFKSHVDMVLVQL